ncbi:hypothetical protein DMB66_54380 [Actinoplanes sp. ATCC 53533]|nr:hypothetical protein DMB66_54380 [Actinoplanes sp. ATCC 53533]
MTPHAPRRITRSPATIWRRSSRVAGAGVSNGSPCRLNSRCSARRAARGDHSAATSGGRPALPRRARHAPGGARGDRRVAVFVEVGVAAAPWLDDWLRGYIVRLRPGPDLLRTLDVYFRNDMSRLGTASALHVHPRTLDYRLQRVRELTGLVPGSTRGVRILSAAVTRALGAGWC